MKDIRLNKQHNVIAMPRVKGQTHRCNDKNLLLSFDEAPDKLVVGVDEVARWISHLLDLIDYISDPQSYSYSRFAGGYCLVLLLLQLSYTTEIYQLIAA